MALHAIYWYLHCSLDDGAADAASLRYCAGVVRCVAHVAGLRSPLLTALRCCKLALLFVVYGAADAASWCSCAGVVRCVAHVAGWRSHGSVADGACSCSWLVLLW